MMKRILAACVASVSLAGLALAGNDAAPAGEPVLERPTLRSLGAYWVIKGDDNKNAAIQLEYRKASDQDWRRGADLFRVEKGAHYGKEYGSLLELSEDVWLFAGSALLLEPDTSYQLRLTFKDPDGGESVKTLSSRTVKEPVAPEGPVYHVIPGAGGGTGTQADPFRGIKAAHANAKPGDTFLLHAGVYEGPVVLSRSGEEGKPIIWRGEGEAIIDAQGSAAERPDRAIQAVGVHDVWFENLTIRNAKYGIVSHESGRIVLRRSHLHNLDFGLTATKNGNDAIMDYFITDNVIEGPSTWPRSEGIEDARGVQLTGAGHVVAYNRIRAFGDAIDTMPSPRCEAIDFHNNEISELTDDGIEMDYSYRNTRCFENRLTNVYQGISTQPVYGGPIYIFRNAMYNVCVEPFKMHNGPSGALMIHNTSVKKGIPLMLWTNKPISNCVYRNNLFIGTPDNYAFVNEAEATDCDYDYDGFGGAPFGMFLKWNKTKYATLEEVKAKAPIYKNAVLVDPKTVFAAGVRAPADENVQVPQPVDLRLSGSGNAVDAGQVLPGINDGFAGQAPDLGAYETGAALPHYGPRPQE